MKVFRLALFFLAALSVGALALNASTLTLPTRAETQPLRWKRQVIQIAVSTSLSQPGNNVKTNSDVIGALTRSLDAWSKAAGIEFQLITSEKQSVSAHGRVGDGVSLITIAPSAENLLIFARDPYVEAARTRTFFNRKGFITEADIVLNPFQQFSSDGTYGTFDLETTFAHEIGHLLGLKHSAVIGSLMSDKVARNTAVRSLDYETALLSESDVSAIRNLYGIDDDDCCGAITGKLLLQSGKAARQVVVWAEDSETGLIVGQSETSTDGSYRIGGLKSGEYSLFWQRREKGFESLSGEVGKTTVDSGNIVLPTQKVPSVRSTVLLTHIGTGMQLGDSAVEVKAGGEYTIVIGGTNIESNFVNLEFNSPYLQTQNSSLRVEDFGSDVEALSFILKIDRETPTGTYSIFARDREDRRSVMIGAISVKNAFK